MKCPFWGSCQRTNSEFCEKCVHYWCRKDYYVPRKTVSYSVAYYRKKPGVD